MVWKFSSAQKIALGYIILALAGAALLSMPICQRQPVNWTDVLFTSVSASYVTGLTTVTTSTTWTPWGAAVLALLIQAGGSGITVATTFVYLLLGRKINIGQRKWIAEDKNFSVHGIVRLVKAVLYYSLVIEGVAAALFAVYFRVHLHYAWLRAVGFAAFQSISAFNNAGFDLWGDSLEEFQSDPFVLLLTSALIILGGLGFVVLTELTPFRARRPLSLHTRIVLTMTAWLLGLGTVLILLLEAQHAFAGLSWPDKWLNAWFTAVSLRTAGFDSVPIGDMRDVTWLICIIWMFIGASPGSTGGGIKTTTFYTLCRATWATWRGQPEMVVHERTLPWDVAAKAQVIFFASLAWVVCGACLAAVVQPEVGVLRLLFEEVSAFGTVGLTTGITSEVNTAVKWILMVTMFIGRIGMFTFLLSLVQRLRPHARYIEERIWIG
ncbi:MAG: Trk family potassium uptake protein [Alicyclobacillus sp.]|nr:Trk family potassium uptake protein [Alicyclobacillus sp.]